MYKLDVVVDTRESAALERRRNMEKQRQSRIFNARERTIGLDLSALDKQVMARKVRENTEKYRHEAYALDMIRNDKIVEITEQRQQKDIRRLNEELLEYRKEHQRPEDRREFHLNDPELLKKDLPARVSDDDPRLHVSGLQLLDGEDLQYEERKKLQQEERREWVRQQTEEKKRLQMEQDKADRLYDLKAVEMDQRAMDLALADEETRRAINTATTEYNQALAKEKAAQRQQDLAKEEDNNFTEMGNMIHGDLLTENPEVALSAFGAHRVIPDRWKGMSPTQLAEIRAIQAAQQEERAQIEAQAKALEEEWDRRRLAEARAGLLLENQAEQERRQLQLEVAKQNRLLAAEQRARQEVLNNEVYINPPSEHYFKQFNTSSR